MPGDDDLALTATVPGSHAASTRKTGRESLGRFKLERQLGAGGMGVVHSAFDPELERRVALKVLHLSNADTRTRLLREARAMAKLSHPNVITVFEVGSTDGEDFVAMELIDGETLGDWLARAKPRTREILAAFVAAGRGLAAAHAEGLVHRDFKPNNVLRSKTGRIVVTDFGLARAEGVQDSEQPSGTSPGIALDQTLAPTAPALTRTGSLLGTPAYMSPEQWHAEPVTPATDQFAFCVALWEALAGKRPFGGDTIDELRKDVLRGPMELDASAIPRGLRPILRRGLSLDPAQRWPSMMVVLDLIEGSMARRRYVAIAAGAGAIATGVAIFFATRSTTPSCAPPAIDPDTVTLGGSYLDHWREQREAACTAPREVRSGRLACLDAVLARLADVSRAKGSDLFAVELVDPAVCQQTPPPHLTLSIDDQLSQAFAALRKSRSTWKPVEMPVEGQPPCVRTVALLAQLVETNPDDAPTAAARIAGLSTQLDAASQACDDDAIKAQAALRTADPDDITTVRRAEAAAKQFPDDANVARIEEVHADQAARTNHFDDALAGYERARVRHEAAARRQLELDDVVKLARTHLARSDAADLVAVQELADRNAELARSVDRIGELETNRARALWRKGDIARADAIARATKYRFPAAQFVDATNDPLDTSGIVVDESGKPVAGASVVAAAVLWGDDVELSSSVAHIATPSETVTGPDGKFELRGARGTIMAALGDRVSPPTRLQPNLTLRLGPTSTIEGDVTLNNVSAGRVRVIAAVVGDKAAAYHVGPVGPGGHFKLTRVPRGKVAFAAIAPDQVSGFKAQPVDVSTPTVTGVHLAFEVSAGNLYIVGRSEVTTTPESVLVMVFRGAHPETKGTFNEIFRKFGGPVGQTSLGPPEMTTLATPFKGHVEADDLIGELANRPAGDLTICAVGLSRKLIAGGTSADKLAALIQDADAGCVVVPDGAELATVPVPAIKRQR